MQTPKSKPLTDIQVQPGRQRQEFDPVDLLELANSIKARGLIHAIVLRKDEETLVAGERRCRAINEHLVPFGIKVRYDGEEFPVGHVPYTTANSDDPLELEEIELAENLKRKDLTWQEEAAAHARLHALRGAQKAASAPPATVTTPGGLVVPIPAPTQSIAETAKEIHGDKLNNFRYDQTRTEIIVANHLHKPEVKAAPDLKTALKIIKRSEDADRNRALARAVGETYSTSGHKVYHANCLELMTQWAADSTGPRFRVIVTDPPYGMGADGFGDAGGKMTAIEHEYKDDYESWLKLMNGPHGWCNLSYQVAGSECHAYVWCDIERFAELKAMMQSAGWYVFRTPLTNYKRNSGRVPIPKYGIRRQSEWCLFAVKGDMAANTIKGDVIESDSDEQLGHGAQKPVSLYNDLIQRSAKPGDLILDSFAGTGTLIPAAHDNKCYAYCIEQNEASYGKCLERTTKLPQQRPLL